MEEKTLFKLTRGAITDTGTDTVSSEGGTVTYRIISIKRKLVNGKVVSTSTPSCGVVGSASVWATWGGVTVGNGYLDVKINYSENNTGSSRSTTLIFEQDESDNKIYFTVTQKAVDIPMYVEILGRYDKDPLTTYKDLPYILNYNGQYVTSGTLPASQDEYLLIPVTKVPWSDKGSYTEPTAIFELYLKGSQLVPYSDFYFSMSFYDAQGSFYGCDREYSQAISYEIDTVDPSDWTPSGSYSHGSITVKKGNLSPSDFSGGILIELILGNKINGYVKRVMLRIKIN